MVSQFYGSIAKSLNAFQTCFKAIFKPCLTALYIATIQSILETYASREAYEKHIASEHFQKYKQGTLHMVKSLVLSDQKPLNPANKLNNFMQ